MQGLRYLEERGLLVVTRDKQGAEEVRFLTVMPGQGTTKLENHPHPSLPRRGRGIKGKGIFI
ncbi:MAG: hypothetical protein COZ70_10070 [Deltaproteobacteria bacterium CG_4_8_14_3_um_filter_51_11]|nr:MAG: hypothetical protein AUK25_10880 [Desulfobacteraceae bacterium CG2_30_51_40]PIP44841.1 MAG: hypothetical protein COX16_16335 [Deltaproteobacteria bacterium CG23_combo_of_CG06-09_8_20_14_all_51_20]PIX19232.1 MAG: hypothetical protein COZ70_10070 [Deltaproteobacteria bacterium CG_4_8_14_3_um_filter_51_11]PIY25621.1 MAG: hypothetical protein COZ11_04790 [Deltaproteobacteria bacterium CG_4_10_14_3_um_filter_51_14]PJB37306.1 MAG: hypothetical protein CO107_05205 [Deltaproteobacteria bacteriu